MSKEPVIKAPSKTEFLESFCSTPNIIKQRKIFFRAQSGYCKRYEKKSLLLEVAVWVPEIIFLCSRNHPKNNCIKKNF